MIWMASDHVVQSALSQSSHTILPRRTDVLDQFSKPQAKPAPASTKPQYGPPLPPTFDPASTGGLEGELGSDFAAELAANMESLMKELVGDDPPMTANVNPEEEKEMREAWEKLIIGDLEGDAMASAMTRDFPEFKGKSKSDGKAKTATATAGPASEDAFQKTIREAMDRLKTSDDSAKVCLFNGTRWTERPLSELYQANSAGSSDPLAQLLAQLGDVSGGDGDGEDDGDVKGLLESLMSQLMSKELLYEPLKELDEKVSRLFYMQLMI